MSHVTKTSLLCVLTIVGFVLVAIGLDLSLKRYYPRDPTTISSPGESTTPRTLTPSSPQGTRTRKWAIFQDLEAGLEFYYPSDWGVIEDVPGCDVMNGCADLSGPEGTILIDLDDYIDDEHITLEDVLADQTGGSPLTPSAIRIGGLPTVQSVKPSLYESFDTDTKRTRSYTETIYYVLVPPSQQSLGRIYSFRVITDTQVLYAEAVLGEILVTVKFSEMMGHAP